MKNQELTSTQKRVLALMLQFKRDSEISDLTGVRPTTLSTWKKQPAFKAELDKGISEIYANESLLKTEIRAKAWGKLLYLIDLNSTKAILKALDLTKPEGNTEIQELSVRFGPPLAKKTAAHLEGLKDPTEEEPPVQ